MFVLDHLIIWREGLPSLYINPIFVMITPFALCGYVKITPPHLSCKTLGYKSHGQNRLGVEETSRQKASHHVLSRLVIVGRVLIRTLRDLETTEVILSLPNIILTL